MESLFSVYSGKKEKDKSFYNKNRNNHIKVGFLFYLNKILFFIIVFMYFAYVIELSSKWEKWDFYINGGAKRQLDTREKE
ncbi:hypothetical protein [Commensalibacter papalotli (ex Servin-Garciduenas et al. 2014)]|uniref:Uncharacterized protein n=1 Tax=Commensalibacter papalotli (ex Servin-Garciduenas et al. 2014) TaxID=1208583 RepID=W7DSP5_9PROT|nr:hypothetical protein [Commensalibacter papalotli (ex Servin-Garciduenas et al. 2014)]EUK17945.1 hypothetical protein COMX_08130 [Commensalibacter papalotli (ex Servin-Garciduenas et al. 2014)]